MMRMKIETGCMVNKPVGFSKADDFWNNFISQLCYDTNPNTDLTRYYNSTQIIIILKNYKLRSKYEQHNLPYYTFNSLCDFKPLVASCGLLSI